MIYRGKNYEYLEIDKIDNSNQQRIEKLEPSELLILWFESDSNTLEIDGRDYTFQSNELVCLTEFHKVKARKIASARMIKWNKYFYCVINHDSEVGCKGILFYGAVEVPCLAPSEEEIEPIRKTWANLEKEMMNSDDSLQLEMLQMTLKRLLINLTRIYKNQKRYIELEEDSIDLVREYHFLVEQFFKEKHTVRDYAEMLNRSPKTLSNVFKKVGNKPPLQFIKDRKMLEAKRLLNNRNISISEIGYTIGFSDVQSFSRFFKREEGISPNHFKERIC